MKRLSIIILALIIPMIGFSQSRGKCPYRYHYGILSINPTAGGLGTYSLLDSGGSEFHMGFSGGLLVDVRPVKAISIKTGILYNKVIDASEYVSVPLTLNFYTGISKFVISAGPVFLFDIYPNNPNSNPSIVGYTAGLRWHFLALNFYGIPKDLMYHRGASEIDRVFMLGFSVEVPITLLHKESHLNRYFW